jgi:hypothetical protein
MSSILISYFLSFLIFCFSPSLDSSKNSKVTNKCSSLLLSFSSCSSSNQMDLFFLSSDAATIAVRARWLLMLISIILMAYLVILEQRFIESRDLSELSKQQIKNDYRKEHGFSVSHQFLIKFKNYWK